MPGEDSSVVRFLRESDRLRNEYAAGEGSRTMTATLPQRLLLARLLKGVSGPEAESIRLVLDLDELVSAGQKGSRASRC